MAFQSITSLTTQVQESTTGQQEIENQLIGIPSNNTKNFSDASEGAINFIADYGTKISGTGDFSKFSGLSVLVNSIRTLLITPVGSYPFDPTYGSNLYKKVFEPADAITEDEIRTEVVDKILEYDERITITNVSTEFFSNLKGFRINLTIQRDRSEVATSVDITENIGFSLEEG